ncbi:MAG: hypothetical protein ACXWVS_12690 [Hyphomicrobium sp.]
MISSSVPPPQFFDQSLQPFGAQPHLKSGWREIDPFDQQPQKPRLLGGKQILPKGAKAVIVSTTSRSGTSISFFAVAQVRAMISGVCKKCRTCTTTVSSTSTTGTLRTAVVAVLVRSIGVRARMRSVRTCRLSARIEWTLSQALGSNIAACSPDPPFLGADQATTS